MGVTSGNPIHFVGDPCARVVYVTEGALKADIAHALTGRTFVATVGVNNTMGLDELFSFLHRNGTEEIIEAEDMDKYSNEHVSRGRPKSTSWPSKTVWRAGGWSGTPTTRESTTGSWRFIERKWKKRSKYLWI